MKDSRKEPRFRSFVVDKSDDVYVISFVNGDYLNDFGDRDLRDDVRRLLEEDKPSNLLIDLANVRYTSSAVQGALVWINRRVGELGGKMILFNVSPLIMDVINVMNLNRVLTVVLDRRSALEALSSSGTVVCPVTECDGKILVAALETSKEFTVKCPACETKLSVVADTPRKSRQVQLFLSSLEFPTFEGESAKITLTPYARLSLLGRLDVFSSGVLERAWKTLSTPRQAVFDLTKATTFSQRGVEALIGLCSQTTSSDRGVILIDKRRKDQVSSFPSGPPVYTSEPRATSALQSGHGSPAAKIPIKVIHH